MELIQVLLCVAATIGGIWGMVKAGDNNLARRVVALLAAALVIFSGPVAALLYPPICAVLDTVLNGVLLVVGILLLAAVLQGMGRRL